MDAIRNQAVSFLEQLPEEDKEALMRCRYGKPSAEDINTYKTLLSGKSDCGAKTAVGEYYGENISGKVEHLLFNDLLSKACDTAEYVTIIARITRSPAIGKRISTAIKSSIQRLSGGGTHGPVRTPVAIQAGSLRDPLL